jgi:CHAT domain
MTSKQGALVFALPTVISNDELEALEANLAPVMHADSDGLATALRAASAFRLLYLATHGDEDSYGGLTHALYVGGRQWLQASDLMHANLPAFVIIAACSSGGVRVDPAREAVGPRNNLPGPWSRISAGLSSPDQ